MTQRDGNNGNNKKTEPIQDPVTPDPYTTDASQGGREIIPQSDNDTEDGEED